LFFKGQVHSRFFQVPIFLVFCFGSILQNCLGRSPILLLREGLIRGPPQHNSVELSRNKTLKKSALEKSACKKTRGWPVDLISLFRLCSVKTDGRLGTVEVGTLDRIKWTSGIWKSARSDMLKSPNCLLFFFLSKRPGGSAPDRDSSL